MFAALTALRMTVDRILPDMGAISWPTLSPIDATLSKTPTWYRG